MAHNGLEPQPTIPAVLVRLEAGAVSTTTTARRHAAGPRHVRHDPADDNQIASFSSWGPTHGNLLIKPDVVAPGGNVISSFPDSSAIRCRPKAAGASSAASMATPHLAGAAAVVRGAHPSWTAAQVRSAVVNTAREGRAPAPRDELRHERRADRRRRPARPRGRRGRSGWARSGQPLVRVDPEGFGHDAIGADHADEPRQRVGDVHLLRQRRRVGRREPLNDRRVVQPGGRRVGDVQRRGDVDETAPRKATSRRSCACLRAASRSRTRRSPSWSVRAIAPPASTCSRPRRRSHSETLRRRPERVRPAPCFILRP